MAQHRLGRACGGVAAVTGASIAVAVVNHNTRDHLRCCLESVLKEGPAQTIVVDTRSSDGSAEMARQEFPSVTVHEVDNRGYGAAANVALESARADYVLLLNADTRLEPGTLEALRDYLGRHPRVVVAGPRVIGEGGRVEQTARRFPTPLELLLQESGLHAVLRPWRGTGPSQRVDWLLGAALLLRREAVEEIGGFDESYFMYGEEIDLCLRLRRAGWEIHYAPVATIVHVGGASTSQRRADMTAQYARSTLLLYRRHRRLWETMLARLVLALALAAKLVRDLLLIRMPTRRRHAERVAVTERVDGWRQALAVIIRDGGDRH
jgi:GT2 family glycosyltransferase